MIKGGINTEPKNKELIEKRRLYYLFNNKFCFFVP
jgi:hypothetical protein